MTAESVLEVSHEYVDYAGVFLEKEANILVLHWDHDYAIKLQLGSKPPLQPIYLLSQNKLQVLWDYIQMVLDKGWIVPSTSPTGVPILFASKKDGDLQLYVDYRGLNEIIIKNHYPLSLISEIMDWLAGANVFTQLDLHDTYHWLCIWKGDEWKTAFCM